MKKWMIWGVKTPIFGNTLWYVFSLFQLHIVEGNRFTVNFVQAPVDFNQGVERVGRTVLHALSLSVAFYSQ